MKLVAGLGNPGSRYNRTRHNVGFEVLAELSQRWHASSPQRQFQAEIVEARFHDEKILLAAPHTLMNLSGNAIGQIVKFYQIPLPDILVVCDDMNLPLGKLRFRAKGSAGGQKGLKHIIEVLASEEIPRLRIGISRPPGQMDPADYVLSRFRPNEIADHDDAIHRSALGVETWIEQGVAAAMNQFNGDDKDASSV